MQTKTHSINLTRMTTEIALHALQSVTVKIMPDTDPDLSYLDQYEDSTDAEEQEYYAKDQERKAHYGDSWAFVGIQVRAVIVVNGTCQTISSGGLWGIEDDSERQHLTDVANDEAADLLTTLLHLNVNTEYFPELLTAALLKANL